MATGKWEISPFEEKMLELLQAEIKKKGISQAKIVSRTGIPKSSLSRMLNGKMQMDVNHLYQICQALDLTTSAVLARAEDTLKPSNPNPNPTPKPKTNPPAARSFPDPATLPQFTYAAKRVGYSRAEEWDAMGDTP